jgi:Tol biopolymer transport system component
LRPLAVVASAAFAAAVLAGLAAIAADGPPPNPFEGTRSPLSYEGEKHLANVRQLTDGGENAEAYWSSDGKKLIFQSTRPPHACDQIFEMNPDDPAKTTRLLSTGKGRTTCAYFFPDGKRYLYASTHLGGDACPPPADMSQGYVWALYPEYDIFSANLDGSGLKRLTTTPGYDAEATISTDGKRIVFTSARDGDLELYAMDAEGSNVKRLTNTVGYDGGAFFSDDGQWLVYRAHHPTEPKAVESFKALLARSLIKPTTLEVRVMRADGTGDRQVTSLAAASFAPFFFRGGHDRILFCSNTADPKGRNFDLWAVNADGSNLERITFNPTFDGFPMFSPDGKRLAFCSNRHNGKPGETNVFVADWVP